MTLFRITLRCLVLGDGYRDRTYRVDAWSREDALRKARDLAIREGFPDIQVLYCMPAFVDEVGT